MWRAFASLILTFIALGWATIISALCFFYGAALWGDLFGRDGAFYGALVAFAVCFLGARTLLRWADRLLEPYTGPFDERAYRNAPRETFYGDWQRYAGDIVRNRRYAFYARTRQWDKLAALEAQVVAAGAGSSGARGPQREVLQPGRTSMGEHLPSEEVSRAARRISVQAPRIERWTVFEEYEIEDAEEE
jgi:hypothetical protein